MEEFDEIKNLLAHKYTQFLKIEMLDIFLGRLEAELANREYIRAREQAWANALSLSRDSSAANRQAFVDHLDRQATAFAKDILGRNLAPVTWVTGLLRHLEDRFPGCWSEFCQ
jgi:hypothetical protein